MMQRMLAVLATTLAVVGAFQAAPMRTASRAAAAATRPRSALGAVTTGDQSAWRVPKKDKKSFLPPILGGIKAGTKKLVVITGASSGLGLETTKVLTSSGYYVICAVRDTDKMDQEASRMGIDKGTYQALECELADFASVRKFASDLKAFKGPRPLDALVCNAAVYRPKDPEPLYSADGFEMSMAVNHLGHFLLANLVLEDMAKNKAKDARVVIVGSITGNSNTVGGGLVYPRADVGQFQGWEKNSGVMQPMVDGSKFFGAKAYKDAKVCNMMTVAELHRRYHEDTGVTFSSLYPGCIAETPLFREKRPWFRKAFPWFMKYVTGGYVSMPESGERLAQVVTDPVCKKSGVYWSWNGGAKTVAFIDPKDGQLRGAGGSGGEIFENDQSSQVTDLAKQAKMWDLSSKLCGVSWPDSYKGKK